MLTEYIQEKYMVVFEVIYVSKGSFKLKENLYLSLL